MARAMQRSKHLSSAVRCIATAAIAAAIFALANRPTTRSTPLSPAEVAIVGTWTYPDDTSGLFHTVSFSSDRTCVFDNTPAKYPSRWRIDGGQLVFHHRYQTVIGRTPIYLPTAVENFELPSFMAKTEEILRPVTFSPDGCLMTLQNIPSSAVCTLRRADARGPIGRENKTGRTMP